MTRLQFPQIIDFLNRIPTVSIDPQPKASLSEQWALYNAEYRVHGNSFPFTVLHLQSGITSAGAKEAAKLPSNAKTLHVVYSPSLKKERGRFPAAVEQFRARSARFDSYREYLHSFLREELEGYTDYLRSMAKADYVDPQVTTPSGLPRRIPNPIENFLIDTDTLRTEPEGMLGVLLAQPGQGKTYMSENVVARLAASSHVIPIYVCSNQWETMRVEDMGSLWKTLTQSFSWAGKPISWVIGYEDSFIRTTLQAGLFRIVFDGFDEYILRNNGKVSADDAINALSELVRSTGARIILTSRTTFWASEFPEGRASEFLYNIEPFDVNQARNYFAKRFSAGNKDPGNVNKSVEVFIQLRQSIPDLAGRGFVLRLIADLFDGDEPLVDTPTGGKTALWLFKALCTRDQARHELPLDATEQIDAIQEFILANLAGMNPDSELLDLAISQVAPRLDESARHATIKKMTSHPLICRVSAGDDEWHVSQEQVRVILVARFISCCALGGTATELRELLQQTRGMQITQGFLRDVGNALVELDFEAPTGDDSGRNKRACAIVQRLLQANDQDISSSKNMLSRLAGIMLLRLIDSFGGRQHSERAAMLFDSVGGSSIRNVTFSGTVASLNLSGRVFESCRFEHVRWHNCEFDENTRFEKCHFDGIELNNSNTIVEADFDDSTYDEVARDYLKRIEIARGKRTYGSEDLEGDIRCVLQKFAPRGGLIPRTQKESYLASGTIRVSPHKDDVISAIKRDVLEQHHISGTSDNGFHVRDDVRDEFQFFVVNNVFTGRLKELLDELKKKLKVG